MQSVSSIGETTVGVIEERGTRMCAEFNNRVMVAADLKVASRGTSANLAPTHIDSARFDDTGWSEEEHAQFLCATFRDFRFRTNT